MNRRLPPDIAARAEYIRANGIVPGAKVLDKELRAIAVVQSHTPANMTRIRYEDPVVRQHYPGVRLVNPTRLHLALWSGAKR